MSWWEDIRGPTPELPGGSRYDEQSCGGKWER